MKLPRKLIIILFTISLFFMFFLWGLTKAVNPKIVKEYVSQEITSLTALSTQIDDPVSWQLFPQPAIKLSRIQVGNSNDDSYSFYIEKLLFKLKIMPLLTGKLVFSEVKIQGLNVNMNTDRELPHKQSSTQHPTTSVRSTNDNHFAIEKFTLNQGQINLINHEQKTLVSELHIQAEQINLQNIPFSFQLKGKFNQLQANKPFAKAHFQFKGSTNLSPDPFKKSSAATQSESLSGQFSIQNLVIDQLKIQKLSSHLTLNNGVILLNPLKINLYNGVTVGSLRYGLNDKKLQLDQAATGLDSAKLSKDLFDKRLFKGKLDFFLHAQTVLNPNWRDTIAGNGTIGMKDGSIELVNLNKIIQSTSNKINLLLQGKKTKTTPSLDAGPFSDPDFFKGNTPFNLLTLQYRLENNFLYSDSLVLQTDILHLKGEGSLNLQNEALDSRIQATVTLTDGKLTEVQQLLGGNFPLLVTGSLTKPLVVPDLKKINPILTKLWLKNALTKPVRQITNQLFSIFQS